MYFRLISSSHLPPFKFILIFSWSEKKIIHNIQDKILKQTFSAYLDTFYLPRNYTMRWSTTIAQLIHLHLPTCRPGFESQAHHLRFNHVIFELCHVEKTKL